MRGWRPRLPPPRGRSPRAAGRDGATPDTERSRHGRRPRCRGLPRRPIPWRGDPAGRPPCRSGTRRSRTMGERRPGLGGPRGGLVGRRPRQWILSPRGRQSARPPGDAQPIDKADATRGEVAYVHDACTRPGYPREPGWAIRTRLGEAGEVRTMGRNGIKLGPRATIFVVVLLAASAVGILTPTLSNTVSKDVQVNGFAVTLTVDGVPDSVAPGDIFRVTAAMANNANRPVPAVLRMEVRNPNTTTPSELTVYAGCGAEEVVSGTRLIYYIGWHGPLLAPKGVSFAAGSTIAAVDAAIGTVEYWPPVLHEIQDRDPAGYVSLVDPGRNASAGVRNSGSALLKVLNYYAMVASKNNESSNLADWTLTTVFADRFIAFGGGAQDGFLVEAHPQTRGSLSFKFWAERPDGLGIPHHPTYTCGPL